MAIVLTNYYCCSRLVVDNVVGVVEVVDVVMLLVLAVSVEELLSVLVTMALVNTGAASASEAGNALLRPLLPSIPRLRANCVRRRPILHHSTYDMDVPPLSDVNHDGQLPLFNYDLEASR